MQVSWMKTGLLRPVPYIPISLQWVTIQSVSKMPGQISGVSSAHKKKQKDSYQYMSANSVRGIAQQRVDLSPFDVYLWGHLKPYCVHLPLKMKTLHQCILDACQTISNGLGTLKERDSSWQTCPCVHCASGEKHFEHLLWIASWYTIRTQQILNW
jgi:hypothetical protein